MQVKKVRNIATGKAVPVETPDGTVFLEIGQSADNINILNYDRISNDVEVDGMDPRKKKANLTEVVRSNHAVDLSEVIDRDEAIRKSKNRQKING